MSATRSRHVFGSETNIDLALQDRVIDAYDILFITEGKIGWVNESGNKVVLNGKQQVAVVNELPTIGDNEVLYIYNSKMHFWDNGEYKTIAGDTGMNEADIEDKINELIDSAFGSTRDLIDEHELRIKDLESGTVGDFVEISDDEIDAMFISYIS